ncbi:MAG TPA: hypothetical protein VN885_07170 [Candidatus Acidoferrales bacterium]|nr:hypothetical protein [Candidatus Acidoferrales bacterium]
MKTVLQWGLSILLLGIVVAQPVAAYEYPLSSTAIRDAYFLGSGDPVKLGNFLEQYAKHYPVAKSGQYVASIRFETPYYIIAEYVSQASALASYHAPDAEQEFLGKPGLCRVRVEIYYGISSTYTGPYQTNYNIQLKQHDKEIPIKRTWTEGMVSTDNFGPTIPGVYLTAEYSADDVDSEAPATVEVLAPDGNNVTETFALDSLR